MTIEFFDYRKSPCEVDQCLCPFFLVLRKLAKKSCNEIGEFVSKCCPSFDKYSIGDALRCYYLYLRWSRSGGDCRDMAKAWEKEIPEEMREHLKSLDEFIRKNSLVPIDIVDDIELYHIRLVHPCGSLIITMWQNGWEISETDGVSVENNAVICGSIPKTTVETIEKLKKKMLN